VRSPAGRDLGPSTQEEIAVAILAELVDWRHGLAGDPAGLASAPAASGPAGPVPAEAVDPVCGMTVAVAGAPTAVRDGVTWYFCSVGCRDHFQSTGGP
jgi:YHS domain-containing protein